MNEDGQGKRLACVMEGLDLQKKPIIVVGRSRAVVVVVGDMLSLSPSNGGSSGSGRRRSERMEG